MPSISPSLLPAKHCPGALPLCVLILPVSPATGVAFHLSHFTDENTDAWIRLTSRARHDACLHQAVKCALMSKLGSTLAK